jgi:AraC-like DNA-binding protein
MADTPNGPWPVMHEGYTYQAAFLRTYETTEHDLASKLSLGWMTISSRAYDYTGRGRVDITAPAATFQYTLSGQGLLEIEQQTYTVSPGWAFLLKHPGEYRYSWPGGEPWEVLYCTLFGLDALRHIHAVIERCGFLFELTPEAPVIRLLHSLLDEIPRENPSTAEAASVYTYRLAMALREMADHQHARYPEPVAKIKHYLVSHLNADVTLDQLSELTGLTSTYLCHLFHTHLGVSPMRYLLHLRLHQAQAMLRDTRLSSRAIADLCGFHDAGYFCTVFRAQVGMSPLAYRRRQTEQSQ